MLEHPRILLAGRRPPEVRRLEAGLQRPETAQCSGRSASGRFRPERENQHRRGATEGRKLKSYMVEFLGAGQFPNPNLPAGPI